MRGMANLTSQGMHALAAGAVRLQSGVTLTQGERGMLDVIRM